MKSVSILLIAATLVVTQQVFAQELEDDRYLTEFFGTTAYIITPSQLDYPENSWWVEALPEELTYDMEFVARVVNEVRSAKGVTPLLDAMSVAIYPGMEEQVDEGFQYDFTFPDMRPSEVEAIFDALGGFDELFPDAELQFMPLPNKDFYVYAEGLDSMLEIQIAGETYQFDAQAPITSVREKLDQILREAYGDFVILDVYMSTSIDHNGFSDASLSFYVEIPAG